MKKLFFSLVMVFSASAFAGRPDTAKMTCADANALVEQNGAVVMNTTKNLWDRYVANGSYCGTGEKAVSAYVLAADTNSCFVGYACRDHEWTGSVIVRPAPKCKEGSLWSTTEYNYNGNTSDKGTLVTYTCKNGKWIDPKAPPKKAPKIIKCKEGRREVWREEDSSGDRSRMVIVECQNGKWKKVNP